MNATNMQIQPSADAPPDLRHSPFKKGLKIRKHRYILGITVLLVIAYCILFGFQTVAVLPIWYRTNGIPGFEAVPKKLDITSSVKATKITSLSCYGYLFHTPWEDIEQNELDENGTLFTFDGGKEILIYNQKNIVKPNEWLFENLSDFERSKAVEIFGPETIESEYFLMKECLEETPNLLNIFAKKDKALINRVLLILKYKYEPLAETGIYSFELPGVRGFQLGMPSKSSKVLLHLFDEHDKVLEMLVLSHNVLYQDEINCILKTFRKNI